MAPNRLPISATSAAQRREDRSAQRCSPGAERCPTVVHHDRRLDLVASVRVPTVRRRGKRAPLWPGRSLSSARHDPHPLSLGAAWQTRCSGYSSRSPSLIAPRTGECAYSDTPHTTRLAAMVRVPTHLPTRVARATHAGVQRQSQGVLGVRARATACTKMIDSEGQAVSGLGSVVPLDNAASWRSAA